MMAHKASSASQSVLSSVSAEMFMTASRPSTLCIFFQQSPLNLLKKVGCGMSLVVESIKPTVWMYFGA